MGFNISGIVINKNFDRDIQKVAKELNWNIEFVSEVCFEIASRNRTPKTDVNVYFTDHSTLIFLNYQYCESGHIIEEENIKVLTFHYTATAMIFLFYLWEGYNFSRELIEYKRENHLYKGRKLPYESDKMYLDELIFKGIEDVLGKSYFHIENGELAYHCKFISEPYTTSLGEIL